MTMKLSDSFRKTSGSSSGTASLTPDKIIAKLFSFHNQAHFLHLQTKSFAEHKALDEAYKDLVEIKDDIAEFMLGAQVPERFGALTLDPIYPYHAGCVLQLGQEIFDFSVALCDYSDSENLEELCNLASDLQQIGVKLKYFSSLK